MCYHTCFVIPNVLTTYALVILIIFSISICKSIIPSIMKILTVFSATPRNVPKPLTDFWVSARAILDFTFQMSQIILTYIHNVEVHRVVSAMTEDGPVNQLARRRFTRSATVSAQFLPAFIDFNYNH